MSEASETVEAIMPEVGPDSKPGPRWFVSRCPEWTTTMEPETKTILGDTVVTKKAKRITFSMQAKPSRLIGRGTNETGNEMGDKNQSRLWGVLFVKGESEHDKKVLAYLRGHENYKMTTQDNAPEANALLKELTFNPAARDGKAEATLLDRRSVPSSDKPAQFQGAPTDEHQTSRPGARIGVKAKGK